MAVAVTVLTAYQNLCDQISSPSTDLACGMANGLGNLGVWHSVHTLDLNADSQQQLQTVFRQISGGHASRAVCEAAQGSALSELSCRWMNDC